jgi:hypothetical protein
MRTYPASLISFPKCQIPDGKSDQPLFTIHHGFDPAAVVETVLHEGTPDPLLSTSQNLCNLVKSWASVPLPRFPRSAPRVAEDGVQNLSAPGLRLCSRIGCASGGQSALVRPLAADLPVVKTYSSKEIKSGGECKR